MSSWKENTLILYLSIDHTDQIAGEINQLSVDMEDHHSHLSLIFCIAS
jgi:hypothetical protein